MPDQTSVTLTSHQQALFTDILRQEQEVQRMLEIVAVARKHAALAIIAQQYDLSTVTGNVSVGADAISFTLNPAPDAG